MNKREQQKLETKEKIIDIATNLFSENGFSEVSTLDVAKKAGVSHGTIFSHFKSRDELIFAVVERFSAKLLTRINTLMSEDMSLKEIITIHLSSLLDYEDFYRELIIVSPRLTGRAKNQYIFLMSSISEIISCAKEEQTKLEPNAIFTTWVSLLHYHLTSRPLFSPGESVIEKKGKEIKKLFMSLVMDKKEMEGQNE